MLNEKKNHAQDVHRFWRLIQLVNRTTFRLNNAQIFGYLGTIGSGTLRARILQTSRLPIIRGGLLCAASKPYCRVIAAKPAGVSAVTANIHQ